MDISLGAVLMENYINQIENQGRYLVGLDFCGPEYQNRISHLSSTGYTTPGSFQSDLQSIKNNQEPTKNSFQAPLHLCFDISSNSDELPKSKEWDLYNNVNINVNYNNKITDFANGRNSLINESVFKHKMITKIRKQTEQFTKALHQLHHLGKWLNYSKMKMKIDKKIVTNGIKLKSLNFGKEKQNSLNKRNNDTNGSSMNIEYLSGENMIGKVYGFKISNLYPIVTITEERNGEKNLKKNTRSLYKTSVENCQNDDLISENVDCLCELLGNSNCLEISKKMVMHKGGYSKNTREVSRNEPNTRPKKPSMGLIWGEFFSLKKQDTIKDINKDENSGNENSDKNSHPVFNDSSNTEMFIYGKKDFNHCLDLKFLHVFNDKYLLVLGYPQTIKSKEDTNKTRKLFNGDYELSKEDQIVTLMVERMFFLADIVIFPHYYDNVETDILKDNDGVLAQIKKETLRNQTNTSKNPLQANFEPEDSKRNKLKKMIFHNNKTHHNDEIDINECYTQGECVNSCGLSLLSLRYPIKNKRVDETECRYNKFDIVGEQISTLWFKNKNKASEFTNYLEELKFLSRQEFLEEADLYLKLDDIIGCTK
ncbi:hypothetical protein BB558_005448 [Smittium angustum]|uniref:Uncharacterized protein n=1 Tax=Smittium angustum TaxID=133377 RepID=A0A2U1J0E4_SMIAN|nr:hypothetical protein BB558_005448 [Smittium angustum]